MLKNTAYQQFYYQQLTVTAGEHDAVTL